MTRRSAYRIEVRHTGKRWPVYHFRPTLEEAITEWHRLVDAHPSATLALIERTPDGQDVTHRKRGPT